MFARKTFGASIQKSSTRFARKSLNTMAYAGRVTQKTIDRASRIEQQAERGVKRAAKRVGGRVAKEAVKEVIAHSKTIAAPVTGALSEVRQGAALMRATAKSAKRGLYR